MLSLKGHNIVKFEIIHISSIFSRNSEANASELLENLEERLSSYDGSWVLNKLHIHTVTFFVEKLKKCFYIKPYIVMSTH